MVTQTFTKAGSRTLPWYIYTTPATFLWISTSGQFNTLKVCPSLHQLFEATTIPLSPGNAGVIDFLNQGPNMPFQTGHPSLRVLLWINTPGRDVPWCIGASQHFGSTQKLLKISNCDNVNAAWGVDKWVLTIKMEQGEWCTFWQGLHASLNISVCMFRHFQCMCGAAIFSLPGSEKQGVRHGIWPPV